MKCLTCLVVLGFDSVSWEGDWRGVTGHRVVTVMMTDRECLLTTVTSAETQHPLLVAKDCRTGMTFDAAVSMKGGGDPHAACLLAKWIDGLGNPASVSSSVVFESSVRRERPLWTRSVLQATLQPMGSERAILTVGDS